MKNINIKYLAFTLAEVLITLGIIGVVAAITIPGLIQKNEKNIAEAGIKEDFSILQQAIRLAEEEGAYSGMEIPDTIAGTKSWFETFFKPFMRIEKVCYDTSGCWHNSSYTKTLSGGKAAWDRGSIGIGYGIITFKLANGTNICIDGYDKYDMKKWFGTDITTSTSLAFYIDANGDKRPNTIGKDIYILVWTDKGLLPSGSREAMSTVESNCSKTASGSNAGYYCSKLVQSHGWAIPDDVWSR